MEEFIASEAANQVKQDRNGKKPSKSFNQLSSSTGSAIQFPSHTHILRSTNYIFPAEKSLNNTNSKVTFKESIKDQEVNLLRQKYRTLVQENLLKCYDTQVLQNTGPNQIHALNPGDFIKEFKRHFLKSLQRDYLIEREETLKEIDGIQKIFLF